MARLDVSAVVDHQRLSEILQQLRSRLRIDAEKRQLRMAVPANNDVVANGAAVELAHPDSRASGVDYSVARDGNVRIRRRSREEAPVIGRLHDDGADSNLRARTGSHRAEAVANDIVSNDNVVRGRGWIKRGVLRHHDAAAARAADLVALDRDADSTRDPHPPAEDNV